MAEERMLSSVREQEYVTMASRLTRKLIIVPVSGISYLGLHHGGCSLTTSQQCVPQKPFSQSLVLTRILGPMFEHLCYRNSIRALDLVITIGPSSLPD